LSEMVKPRCLWMETKSSLWFAKVMVGWAEPLKMMGVVLEWLKWCLVKMYDGPRSFCLRFPPHSPRESPLPWALDQQKLQL